VGVLIAAFGCFAVILVAWAFAPVPTAVRADRDPAAAERA
jgi:hypothetical protein